MRRLVAALVAVAVISGCGTRHETVTPQRTLPLRVALLAPNAAQAPIYAAAATGQFRAAGLAVATRQAPSPVDSLRQLAAGAVDLAVSTPPAVLEARARGEHVTSVAALATQGLSSAIWLPGSGIRSPADLARKRVGTNGLDYEEAYLRTLTGRPVATTDVGAGGLTAAGSGVLHVDTGSLYTPGAVYQVTGTNTAGPPFVTADAGGRLHFDVDLGPSHETQQYVFGPAAEAGFTHAHVDISPQ